MTDQLSLETLYKEANAEHKHYDNVSLAAITAMFICAAGSFNLYETIKNTEGSEFIFILASILTFAFFKIYEGCASHASVARSVAKKIEKGERIGVSTAYMDSEIYDELKKLNGKAITILRWGVCYVLIFAQLIGLVMAIRA